MNDNSEFHPSPTDLADLFGQHFTQAQVVSVLRTLDGGIDVLNSVSRGLAFTFWLDEVALALNRRGMIRHDLAHALAQARPEQADDIARRFRLEHPPLAQAPDTPAVERPDPWAEDARTDAAGSRPRKNPATINYNPSLPPCRLT